jgi:invasion protein IalB
MGVACRPFIACAAAAGFALGAAAFAEPALAQDTKAPAAKKEATPAKPPAPAKEGAEKGAEKKADGKEEPKTAWYKICAKVPVTKKDKDGKETKEEKNACTTFYESFNPATGAPLVYVAIEEGEGLDKKVLTVVVPPGLALPPGMAITVFQKDQWEKFITESKEGKTVKPEDLGLKPIELKYLHCHQTGCASVLEAPPEFIEQMKTGLGVMVRAVELTNRVIDFPVSLKGFAEALAGPAQDTKEFMKFRSDKLKEMQEKRAELVERFKQEKADLLKSAPKDGAAPGATTTAPAAKPAEKAPEKK